MGASGPVVVAGGGGFIGRALCRALMARAEADIRLSGGTALEAYCDMGNTRAERLFASLGFTLVKEYHYIPEKRPLWGEGTRRLRRLLD